MAKNNKKTRSAISTLELGSDVQVASAAAEDKEDAQEKQRLAVARRMSEFEDELTQLVIASRSGDNVSVLQIAKSIADQCPEK